MKNILKTIAITTTTIIVDEVLETIMSEVKKSHAKRKRKK